MITFMHVRNKLFYWMVILILTAFIGLAAALLYKNDNPARLVKAASWQQVKAYQYEKTPGLERAEALKLTRQINQTINIPGTDRTVSLDEIWYNSQYIYFFYSVDMKAPHLGSVKEEDLPVVSFQVKNGQDEAADGSPLFTLNWLQDEGVYYNGRFYGRMAANPFPERDGTGSTAKRDVSQLDLKGMTVRLAGTPYPLSSDIKLAVDYKASQEKTETLPVNQSYTALGQTIEITQFEMGTTMNRLYLRYHDSGEAGQFAGASIVIKTDAGETRHAEVTETLPDGTVKMEFPPFNRRPRNVDIELQSVLFFNGSHRIEFSLNVSKYDTFIQRGDDSRREETRRPIGRIENTDIDLDELYYDNRGIDFTIAYQTEKGLRKPYLHLYPALPGSIPTGAHQVDETKIPMLVRVTNERGEEGTIGQRGGGSGDRFDAFIDKPLIEHSKEIHVTIDNLMTEPVTDWKTSVSIPAGS
ncbi:hypothetical protein [Paenibacillus humicola]|uniref:hypothetical protein n=1 Tax=Paenibacillus humicola TaxID=3110540 RepID=UPI00237B0FF2|nr:hypothetical protein [Paenibacillus humicola]